MRRRFAALLLVAALAAAGGAATLDRLFPLPVGRLGAVSTVVADRDGVPLRVFLDGAGRDQLATTPADVSPAYLALLLDTEDRRFYAHPGIDPLALVRALAQRVARGRVVSGALWTCVLVLGTGKPSQASLWLVELGFQNLKQSQGVEVQHQLGKPTPRIEAPFLVVGRGAAT